MNAFMTATAALAAWLVIPGAAWVGLVGARAVIRWRRDYLAAQRDRFLDGFSDD